MDARQQALVELDGILARASRTRLSAGECLHSVDLLRFVPGRARTVAQSLADQRSPAAVDALLALPASVPGVVEGVFQALARGVCRLRPDGAPFPAMLALDFRKSRARGFPEILARARAAFGPQFERLRVGRRIVYRLSIREGRGTLAGRVSAAAHDLHWLHTRLGRLKGTRLWLNGWCFAQDGPMRTPIQIHLLRAWLSWAAGQVQTRGASRR